MSASVTDVLVSEGLITGDQLGEAGLVGFEGGSVHQRVLRIAAHCAPKSAELYTYSAATAVRVALLTAGFYVAEGTGTGPKASTTAAFTRAEMDALLGLAESGISELMELQRQSLSK